jgi:hypothetical protein
MKTKKIETITYTVPKTGTLNKHESVNRVIGSVSYDANQVEGVAIVRRLKKEFQKAQFHFGN